MDQNEPHSVGQVYGFLDNILNNHSQQLSPGQQEQLQGYRDQLDQNQGYYQQNPDGLQNLFNAILAAAAPLILNYGINAILRRGPQSPQGSYPVPSAPGGNQPADPSGGLDLGGLIGGLIGGQAGGGPVPGYPGGSYPGGQPGGLDLGGLAGLIGGALPGIIGGLSGQGGEQPAGGFGGGQPRRPSFPDEPTNTGGEQTL